MHTFPLAQNTKGNDADHWDNVVLHRLRTYTRAKVNRLIWRLMGGNLCLEPCLDDTFEQAHVFRDGRVERTYLKGEQESIGQNHEKDSCKRDAVGEV